jgi:hypothetical protein
MNADRLNSTAGIVPKGQWGWRDVGGALDASAYICVHLRFQFLLASPRDDR